MSAYMNLQLIGLSLPISVEDIIHLTKEEFLDFVNGHKLTSEELDLCRKIRRKEVNRVSSTSTNAVVLHDIAFSWS